MGKVVAILGMGPSLELYKGDADLTIGVNDIYSKVVTDYIVCVDLPIRFTPERLKIINESKPKYFYTHLGEWSHRPDIYPIELQEQYPKYVCDIDHAAIPKSLCSPFVAAAIAYMLHGATEIHLYGVDMIKHPNIDQAMSKSIYVHFSNLQIALIQKGCKLIVHGEGILKSLNKHSQ